MASKRDQKIQAMIWNDSPGELVPVVLAFVELLQTHGKETGKGQKKERRYSASESVTVRTPVAELDGELNQYRRLSSDTPLDVRLILEIRKQLGTSADGEGVGVAASLIEELADNARNFSRWSQFQQGQEHTELRSDVLSASIELDGSEVLVLTDRDGSTRLRGAVAVPMFLAFWRARGHRLSGRQFEDIDRSINRNSLERYRTRVCARLQQVLLEIVPAGRGFELRRCKS